MPRERERYADAVQSFDWAQVHEALGWGRDNEVSLGLSIVDRHVANPRTALIVVGRDGREHRFSYRDLSEASNRFANALRRRGIGPGDRVAGLMPRGVEVVIAIIATLKLGAIYVPVFTGFGPDAVGYRLEHCGAQVLVTHQDVLGQVPPGTAATLVVVGRSDAKLPEGAIRFDDAMAGESADFESVKIDREQPAALIYTSGSTGQPKGGAIAVNFLAAIWPYIIHGLDLKRDDILWPTGDPGWGYGFICYLGALAAGATVLSVEQNPSAEFCLSVIERYGVTNLATTPTLLRSLLTLDDATLRAPSLRLHAVSSCGEPLNAKVVESFRRVWSVTPMDHFGATEYALPIGNYNAVEMEVKAGSMGLPSPGYTMAIVDDDGKELAAGDVGFIGKKTSPDCRYWLCYWNDPDATRALVRHGWIVTGDLGRRDDDGYFWFEGRAD
ncbi:MAG: AMP-binding protein, partial [Xanthobacteraceae bacterium]